MKKNQNAFIDTLDCVLLLSKEMIRGKGEDSFFCDHGGCSAIVSAFDGCGGLGSRLYESFQGKSGAYIASRAVSGAVRDWYQDNKNTNWTNVEEIAESIADYIKRGYELCNQYAVSNLRIRGSMVRDLPTTAAIALALPSDNGIAVHCLWAGDSRVYLLDQHGLAQISEDDIDDEDAMSNLINDAPMTNVLSSDGKYEIHRKSVLLTEPGLVFAATDGCFGYVPTPMEFEHLILQCLVSAKSPEEFKSKLSGQFDVFASDDYTLALMGFYYGTFERMKDAFREREHQLRTQYIAHLSEGRHEAGDVELWQEYRKEYERFLGKMEDRT